jgi:hypothetical protein
VCKRVGELRYTTYVEAHREWEWGCGHRAVIMRYSGRGIWRDEAVSRKNG